MINKEKQEVKELRKEKAIKEEINRLKTEISELKYSKIKRFIRRFFTGFEKFSKNLGQELTNTGKNAQKNSSTIDKPDKDLQPKKMNIGLSSKELEISDEFKTNN